MLNFNNQAEDLNDQFNHLFSLYWKKLYVVAYNRLKDQDVAKDLVQDVFIYYLQKQTEIKNNVEAYLFKALQYQIIAYYRKHLINTRAFDDIAYQLSLKENSNCHNLDTNDLMGKIKTEMAKMPKSMRSVFDLKIKDYAVDEISAQTGLTQKTVRNNLSLGIKKLKKVIAKDLPHKYVGLVALISTLIGN